LSTYDFFTCYSSLPHSLIRDKLTRLIERTFARENKTFIACNEQRAFFTDGSYDNYILWTCQDITESLNLLLDNIDVRFGTSIDKQVFCIPMGTNFPHLVDLFLYCYERDFMLSFLLNIKMTLLQPLAAHRGTLMIY
jgi:hypothetical protein